MRTNTLTAAMILLASCASGQDMADPSAAARLSMAATTLPHREGFDGGARVTVDVLMVSLPQETALQLLPELRDPIQVLNAQNRILKLVSNGDATLLGWPEVTVQSGKQAVAEAILEQRYPFPFDQPTEPGTLALAPRNDRTPEERALRLLRHAGLIAPDTVETRNVGASMEVLAVVSADNRTVVVDAMPTIVRGAKTRRIPTTMTNHGASLFVEQPYFSTHRTTAHLSLLDGERRLIFFGKGQEDPQRIILFILGAKILPGSAAKR